MNILITGGAGYIGSICVEELLKRKHLVIVLDTLQEGHREAVLPDAVFYRGNVGDHSLLDKIFTSHSIEAVFHFAAETTIEFSMSKPSIYFKNNIVNALVLLDMMVRYNCKRFIFSSTAATFGEPQYLPVDECHPQKPINAYGESKLIFEKILDWYHTAYDLQFSIFRYFNAAGASFHLGEDHRDESHLIPIVLKKALGGKEPLKVFGKDYPTRDGTCIRDYIHVVDLAQAHILALEYLDRYPSGKYNLGNGDGFSVLEVVEAAKKVTGRDIRYEIASRRPGDPSVLVASSMKAKRDLGWKPTFHSLVDIMSTAWEWHKNHPGGYNDHK